MMLGLFVDFVPAEFYARHPEQSWKWN